MSVEEESGNFIWQDDVSQYCKLIGDSWKTMSKLKNNSQENKLGWIPWQAVGVNESKPSTKH